MRQIVALIDKDADSDFGVSFPDLPGRVTAGANLDEARDGREALALHLEGLDEDGDPIPEPSSLEAVMVDRPTLEGVAIPVAAPERAVKFVRVDISPPDDAPRQADRTAAAHGLTRSGLLARAVKREIVG